MAKSNKEIAFLFLPKSRLKSKGTTPPKSPTAFSKSMLVNLILCICPSNVVPSFTNLLYSLCKSIALDTEKFKPSLSLPALN